MENYPAPVLAPSGIKFKLEDSKQKKVHSRRASINLGSVYSKEPQPL